MLLLLLLVVCIGSTSRVGGGEVSGYRSDDGATSSSFRGRSRSTQSARFLQEALVSPRGSVALSPHASNARRKSWGPHMSRYVISFPKHVG